ncbi:MAG TPA: DUF4861 family protein [Acidobacteriaceae bacterium]|jgi:hypothetical protein|nr:DUF4861 family protein [Acidobacteriaceae bacterium]
MEKRTKAALVFLAVVLAGFDASFSRAAPVHHESILEVKNPLDVPRSEQVLALPLAAVIAKTHVDPKQLAIEDLASHTELATQLYSSKAGEAPDQLLVLVNIAAHQTIRLRIHESVHPYAATPRVYGRPVPERMDDFAWENDKVAYRVYGPALQATGEITSGIDVWSKRVPDLIINAWYARDAVGIRTRNPALSYHKDNGQGLDAYDVGPSRGCGGTSIWNDGKLFSSKNYTSVKILASGPIRFEFRLQYAPWDAGEDTVSEQKTITLDAGSHLNRIRSNFSITGPEPVKIAAGLAMHPGAQLLDSSSKDILAVWEPLSGTAAGMDGTAIVLPDLLSAEKTQVAGNALFLFPAASAITIAYYAGAAWSKSDIPTPEAWNTYLNRFALELEHPLEIHWR